MLDVEAPGAARVLVHAAEAGDVAQELLVERPGRAGPDHRPVVEADGRERPAELVDDPQQVALERAEHVLGAHALRRRAPARRRRGRSGRRRPVIMQLGQLPEQQSRPRGRWYLKLREKTPRPAANSAEPIVSPAKACTGSALEREEADPAPVDPLALARAGAASVAHELGQQDLVRARVALGLEPELAAEAVVPPLALDAGDVPAEVEVRRELLRASARFGRVVTSPAQTNSFTSRGPQLGHGSRKDIYCAPTQHRRYHRNANATVMATTRQPSTARIASAPTAPSRCSTRSPRAASSARTSSRAARAHAEHRHRASSGRSSQSGLVEHVAVTGRYRLGIRIVRLANAVLARLDVRAVARPHLEELVRADRRDGDALGARRGGRGDRRLRPERPLCPARHTARPPEHRARDRCGKSDARILGPAFAAAAAARLYVADDHRPGRARARGGARAPARLRRSRRGARAGTHRDRGARLRQHR